VLRVQSRRDRPVFLIGAPRSGSTRLARMLGSHPEIFAPAEPHLMPPLAHLGFHEPVTRRPTTRPRRRRAAGSAIRSR
jgi:hypothetical protein